MPNEKEQLYQLLEGDKVLFVGSYEECKAEWQRRHEKERKAFHDQNAERQIRWQQRGGKDDERDRC